MSGLGNSGLLEIASPPPGGYGLDPTVNIDLFPPVKTRITRGGRHRVPDGEAGIGQQLEPQLR